MLRFKATETKAGKGKVVDENGFSVCSCSGGSYADTVKRAEQISMALNYHDRLVEALRKTRDRLEEYADADETAHGYGFGCFARPFKFIAPTIEMIDEIFEELEQQK